MKIKLTVQQNLVILMKNIVMNVNGLLVLESHLRVIVKMENVQRVQVIKRAMILFVKMHLL